MTLKFFTFFTYFVLGVLCYLVLFVFIQDIDINFRVVLFLLVLVLIPLLFSILAFKFLKSRKSFLFFLNIFNLLPIIFLMVLNYQGFSDYLREKRIDSEANNLNWTKNNLLYQHVVTKRGYAYLKNKYSSEKLKVLYSNIYPINDSDFNEVKPNFTEEVVVYVGERKKENLKMIGLKFDSNLNVSELYNQNVLDDTSAFKERWSDNIQLINILKDTIK